MVLNESWKWMDIVSIEKKMMNPELEMDDIVNIKKKSRKETRSNVITRPEIQ